MRTRTWTSLKLVFILAAALVFTDQTWAQGTATLTEDIHDSSSAKAMDAVLRQAVEDKQIAGVVAIVMRDGEVAYHRALGWQDVESNREMTKESLFRIASMSKPMTSVAVMILVDDGQLKLTDPVSKYLPEFKDPKVLTVEDDGSTQIVRANREITIHDLLTHTSGLTYRFMAQEPIVAHYRKADVCDGLIRPSFSMAENMHHVASVPLLHQPGSAYQYGMSTDVLGRVVEVISGENLETFMRQRIFAPLEMIDTHFDLPQDKIKRLATVYEAGSDKQIQRVAEELVQAGELAFCVTCPYEGQRGYCSGGAGITSSAADYARFLQMLLNEGEWSGKRILKAETVREMTRNQIGDLPSMSPPDGFGYGFGIQEGQPDHQVSAAGTYYWGGFYNTAFWVDPEAKVIGVMMTQLLPPADHLTLMDDFKKLAYKTTKPKAN